MAKIRRIVYRGSSIIGVPGQVKMIYDENIDFESFGDNVSIRRASHVDPGSEMSQDALSRMDECYVDATGAFDSPLAIKSEYAAKWFADCGPTNGPVLGPFNKRSEALEAEEEWVRKNVI